jgi:hypothetical protein
MKSLRQSVVTLVLAVLVVAGFVVATVGNRTFAQGQGSGSTSIQWNVAEQRFHGFVNGSTSTDYPLAVDGTYPNRSVSLTAQTASISTATLCTATGAGGCGLAGLYQLNLSMEQGGTACSNVTAGGVSFQLTWTDNSGNHSAVTIPLITQGSSTAMAASMLATTTLVNSYASATFNFYSTGAVVQYATTYTGCTTGTLTYQLDASVKPLRIP